MLAFLQHSSKPFTCVFKNHKYVLQNIDHMIHYTCFEATLQKWRGDFLLKGRSFTLPRDFLSITKGTFVVHLIEIFKI